MSSGGGSLGVCNHHHTLGIVVLNNRKSKYVTVYIGMLIMWLEYCHETVFVSNNQHAKISSLRLFLPMISKKLCL